MYVDSSKNGSEEIEKVMFPPDGSQSQANSSPRSITVVARLNNKTTKTGKLTANLTERLKGKIE